MLRGGSDSLDRLLMLGSWRAAGAGEDGPSVEWRRVLQQAPPAVTAELRQRDPRDATDAELRRAALLVPDPRFILVKEITC